MILSEIADILDAKVLCGDAMLNECVESAFGADMMSDVLAFVKPHTLVLTGLVNHHVVRTCSMLDVRCVIFVRGKQPTADIVEEAADSDIMLMTTDHTLYESCGMLYGAGLPPVERGI
ncbi:MAG: hypothetical protein IJA35_05815 [Clostridia bacterium]|nr:hypothetical protein [Clostridia bacterium]